MCGMSALLTLAVHRPGHIGAVIVTALVVWWCCYVGRRMKRFGAEGLFRRVLAAATAVVTLTVTVGWMIILHNGGEGGVLPLHICDMAGLIAPLVLFFRVRWLRAVLYFWAMGLTTQGFVTPIEQSGPDNVRFFLFWVNHGLVVGVAIYDLVVGGFRPSRADLLRTIGITGAYATAIFFFNRVMGENYLFIGDSKPDEPTLIDALGAYPLRVVWMFLLAALALCLAQVPWEVARLRLNTK